MESKGARSQPREGFLDFLRFLAALSVVFFHYGFRGHAANGYLIFNFPELSFARYGYLGVPLFFMISGYVITWSIKGHSISQFVAHRFIRLFPTFWLCALLTLTVEHVTHMARFDPGYLSDIANITMVPGWLGFHSIDGSYWSLATELNFYILLGAVVWAAGFDQVENALITWAGTGIVLESLGHPWVIPCGSYYPLFCFGGACYLMNSNGYKIKTIALAVISLGVSIYNTLLPLPRLSAHFHVSFSPVVCAFVVVGAGAMVFFSSRISSLLSRRATRALVNIGGLTYPLYLIHQKSGYSLMDTLFRNFNRWVAFSLTTVIMLASAAAIYIWFDRPVRRKLRALAESRSRTLVEARTAV